MAMNITKDQAFVAVYVMGTFLYFVSAFKYIWDGQSFNPVICGMNLGLFLIVGALFNAIKDLGREVADLKRTVVAIR